MIEPAFHEVIPQKSLRDILAILFRNKKPAIIVFSLVVAVVAIGTILAPRIYVSDAKLLVKLGRENLTLDPTVVTGQIVSISQSRESQINSELEILRSREVIGMVIGKLGPDVFLGRAGGIGAGAPADTGAQGDASGAGGVRDVESAVRRFLEALQVEVLRETNIITVQFRARSPELAQTVVTTLIDFFQTKHIDAHRTQGAREFFIEQTEQYREALARTEREMRDLKNSTSIGALAEQRTILLNRIGTLQARTQETQTSLSASIARVEALQGMLGGLPETLITQKTSGAPNPTATSMRAQLYELQLKEQNLLSKFNENSEPVREVRRQIDEAKILLGREEPNVTQETTGISVAHEQVKGDLLTERAALSALRATAGALATESAKAEEQLRVLNETEVTMAQLERQLVMQRDNYNIYSEKMEQARIEDALEVDRISNISVIQPATYSSNPASPRRTLNMLIGLVLGLFGALGTVFVLDVMNQKLKSPLDIEQRLQLRMIAAVPRLDAGRIGALPQHALAAPAVVPQLREKSPVEKQGGSLVAKEYSEEYGESLWDQLAYSMNSVAQKPRVLAVTSCHAGEGVSTVAASIATMLSGEGVERVLLVDAKAIRRSKYDSRLVLPSSAVMSLGRPTTDAHGPYEARTNADLITLLKRDDSFVVLDLPPVLEKTSALRLCSLADGVVLVVKAETTRWQVAHEAKERLQRASANLLGVVLNERRFYVPDWLYRRL